MSSPLGFPLHDLRFVRDAQFTVDGITTARTPYPFQRVGAGAIVLYPRMVLADETGLGKTLQFLMAIRALRLRREISRAYLVVSRKNLLYQHAAEVEAWFPGCFNTLVVEGDRKKRHRLWGELIKNHEHPLTHRDLVLFTYATARVDREQILRTPYDMVVMDEAHNIRNPEAEQTQATYAICQHPQVKRVVGVTATPVQSRLEEYHSILTAVNPGVLGPWDAFEAEHCKIEQFEIDMGRWTKTVRRISGYKFLDRFKAKVADVVLQRTIDEVGAQMPELIIQDRWLDLTPAQERRYAEIEQGVFDLPGYVPDAEKQEVQYITRLGQIANATQLLYPEPGSAKLDELGDLLRNELRGTQLVIFSKSVQFLELARRTVVEPLRIPHGTIYGGMDARQMEADRQRFQNGDLQVMLMSTAGEEGTNLGAGKYLICLDVLYNPGRMKQVYARIRRLSSVHPQAIIIRLLMKGTLEEGMIELLAKRQALIDFLDTPEKLSPTELAEVMRAINRRVALRD